MKKVILLTILQFTLLMAGSFVMTEGKPLVKSDTNADTSGNMTEHISVVVPVSQENFVVVPDNHPIQNIRISPSTKAPTTPSESMFKLSGSAGEFESISAQVYALKDTKNLRVTASDLKGSKGSTISASALDISIVKWWYTGGGNTVQNDGTGNILHKYEARVLTADLLLKDDALVRVDINTQNNYLRSTAINGTETYVSSSVADLQNARPIDAKKLQPVDVNMGKNKEFWITVHIPSETVADIYSGTITFSADNGIQQSVALSLIVYPFTLSPSPLTYGIYYRGKLSADGQPKISSDYKSEEQYRIEMADMRDHGVLYPNNYQRWDEILLPKTMAIRQELGLPTDAFYNLGVDIHDYSDPTAKRNAINKWVNMARHYGYEDVYFYGKDEASGDRLIAQRETWEIIQSAGAKTFVASIHKEIFDSMGSSLNTVVLAHAVDPMEAKKWNGIGSKIFSYDNPQIGLERPEAYRRNFGLLLWKSGYDGAMDYAYQDGFERSGGHIWNDWSDNRYRTHAFTYPTIDGIVGTLAWEGFREGVDDVRYVATLEKAIKNALTDKEALADQAQTWLNNLNISQQKWWLDNQEPNLNETRATVVEWILKLSQ